MLASAYFPLRAYNKLLKPGDGSCPGRLRVLLYHDIPPQYEEAFASQLRWISRTWKFVKPREFEMMLCGDVPVMQDCVLLSFDDGFSSNRRVAEMVLNPMGIKAIFFVVSNFIELSRDDDWKGFISKYIYPAFSPNMVPNHWNNMTWDDLTYLLETDHLIGAHTENHKNLSRISSNEFATEIVASADNIASRLGVAVNHFAYTFGSLNDFNSTALAVAMERFQYVHTGLRGDNAKSLRSWAVRRDAMSASDSNFLLGSLLEGGADRLYSDNLKTYESWKKK